MVFKAHMKAFTYEKDFRAIDYLINGTLIQLWYIYMRGSVTYTVSTFLTDLFTTFCAVTFGMVFFDFLVYVCEGIGKNIQYGYNSWKTNRTLKKTNAKRKALKSLGKSRK